MRTRRGAVAAVVVLGFMAQARADERADAEAKLEKALGAKDRDGAKAALAEVAKPGDLRAAKFLIGEVLKFRGLDLHSQLIQAIGATQEEAAVKAVAEAAHAPSSARELRIGL